MAAGAALLAAAGLGPATAGEATPLIAAYADPAGNYVACIKLAQTDPSAARARATAWQATGGGLGARHCLGIALAGLRKFSQAADVLEGLAREDATPAPARARMFAHGGRLRLVVGDAGRAYALQTEALALAPEDVTTLIDRSISLALLRRPWQALDDLYRALDIMPEDAEALVFRALVYRGLGSLELARDDFDRALAISPDHPDGLFERGELRRLQGDVEGARADWQRLLARAPGTQAAAAATARLRELDDAPVQRSAVSPALIEVE